MTSGSAIWRESSAKRPSICSTSWSITSTRVGPRRQKRAAPGGLRRSLLGAPARLRQHEPVEQVVGGEAEPLDRPHLTGLLEAENRRQRHLEAEPHEQPVRRARPGAAPLVVGQRAEYDTPG